MSPRWETALLWFLGLVSVALAAWLLLLLAALMFPHVVLPLVWKYL